MALWNGLSNENRILWNEKLKDLIRESIKNRLNFPDLLMVSLLPNSQCNICRIDSNFCRFSCRQMFYAFVRLVWVSDSFSQFVTFASVFFVVVVVVLCVLCTRMNDAEPDLLLVLFHYLNGTCMCKAPQSEQSIMVTTTQFDSFAYQATQTLTINLFRHFGYRTFRNNHCDKLDDAFSIVMNIWKLFFRSPK